MNIKGAYTIAMHNKWSKGQMLEWFEEENTHKQAWEEEN